MSFSSPSKQRSDDTVISVSQSVLMGVNIVSLHIRYMGILIDNFNINEALKVFYMTFLKYLAIFISVAFKIGYKNISTHNR